MRVTHNVALTSRIAEISPGELPPSHAYSQRSAPIFERACETVRRPCRLAPEPSLEAVDAIAPEAAVKNGELELMNAAF